MFYPAQSAVKHRIHRSSRVSAGNHVVYVCQCGVATHKSDRI